MNPNEKPKLTPLEGAKIPPKVAPIAPEVMAEIEAMSKAEASALNTLANASMQTAEMVSIMAETLEDIKDILIKVCQGTGMQLPKRILDAIKDGEYDPDETGEDEEENADPKG